MHFLQGPNTSVTSIWRKTLVVLKLKKYKKQSVLIQRPREISVLIYVAMEGTIWKKHRGSFSDMADVLLLPFYCCLQHIHYTHCFMLSDTSQYNKKKSTIKVGSLLPAFHPPIPHPCVDWELLHEGNQVSLICTSPVPSRAKEHSRCYLSASRTEPKSEKTRVLTI